MAVSAEALLDLVGDIYSVALAPDTRANVLERISDAFGGAGIHTGIQRFPDGLPSLSFVRLDADRMAAFQRDHAAFDSDPMNAKLPALAWPDLVRRAEVVDDWEYDRSPIYNEMIRPQKLKEFAVATLARGRAYVALFTLTLPERHGDFDADQLALLRRLVPHLQRAKRLELRLGELAASNGALLQGLHRLAQGAILVDGEGRIVACNAAAEAILRVGDGLAIRGGKLRAAEHGHTQRLLALIATATATAARRGTIPGGAMALARPSLLRPLQLAVYPIVWSERANLPEDATALVFVADPEETAAPAEALLASLYGLTAAEAAVTARLAQGLDLAEVCERLRIGMPTARTHLARVLAKTGTRRQAELLRLILRGPAGLNGAGP